MIAHKLNKGVYYVLKQIFHSLQQWVHPFCVHGAPNSKRNTQGTSVFCTSMQNRHYSMFYSMTHRFIFISSSLQVFYTFLCFYQ